MKVRKFLILFLIMLISMGIFFSGCVTRDIKDEQKPLNNAPQIVNETPKTAVELPQPENNAAPIEQVLEEISDYRISVLIITDSKDMNNRGTLHHFEQSIKPGVEVTVSLPDQLPELTGFDLVYPDSRLSSLDNFNALSEELISYVENGGVLFLSYEYAKHFPMDFLGIKELHEVQTTAMDFTYPDVRPNLSGLQEVWRLFAEDYKRYEGLNPKYHIDFKYAAEAGSAAVLAKQEGLAYILANQVGDGTVIWSNNFLPAEFFITRFDLVPEEGQRYFHFGYATANYLFRNELLSFIAKEKYGFALKKSFGPYGRPGLAWQNHYESLFSFVQRDMIKWIDLLEQHNQIPTFSLIRGSYNWGKWYSSISVQINKGSDTQPLLPGETENSFFSSGERLLSNNDYLTFGRYPYFRTFLAKIELAHRAYPRVFDWNGDGKKDLIVGTFEGEVLFLKNTGSNESPRHDNEPVGFSLRNGGRLSVAGRAAPHITDFNSDDRPDILVGDKNGRVRLFRNTGSQTVFVDNGFLQSDGRRLQVESDAAPFMTDWDNDGVSDLLVGESSGNVILFQGVQQTDQLGFIRIGPLETVKVASFAAPFVADWDNDGLMDLLVGSGNGQIALYLRNADGTLTDSGKLQGENYNFFGNRNIEVGNNAVPVVVDWNDDGKKDLIVGQLEYGIPYAVNCEMFPHKSALKENIAYAQKKHVPLIPHMFFHEYLNEQQEIREISLHKESFKALGIPWDNDMGVNQHTWRVNNDAVRTFRNQKAAGIWWNFGFNPPNAPHAPRDGKEFLWVIPFLLPDTQDQSPFILFNPAPSINFGQAWNSLARFGIPLTYFEHIEHSMRSGTQAHERLLRAIDFMNAFKDKHEYNFMTEQQMARALLNTFYSRLHVEIEGDSITLIPDFSEVPAQAQEYLGTLGVKIEPGEAFLGKELDTTGLFYHRGTSGFYIDAQSPVTFTFVDESDIYNRLHLVRANGPVQVTRFERGMNLYLNTKGLKEVKIFSPSPLEISGSDLRIKKEGNYYTITHFGDAVNVNVRF